MNIAVIFAGGFGQRANGQGIPKQFLQVNGKPVIIYTLEMFERCLPIDAICISCLEQWIPYLKQQVSKYNISKVKTIVPGGETGQDSIYNGLCAAEQYAKEVNATDPLVLIHDGVRPLVLTTTILENIEIAQEKGNCITCVPVTETLILEDTKGNTHVPERNGSLIARAPQTFRLKDIMSAHCKARDEGRHDFIDSCTMLHHYGYPLYHCIGSLENIKITTPTDFFLFRAILQMRENQQAYGGL